VLTIVVPMAGRGSRFADAGFALPKPLIAVRGVPMIELVIANLTPSCPHRFVFLCLEEHLATYDVEARLRHVTRECAIVPVSGVTQGAACTVLLAKEYIDGSDPLMIANSDQWVAIDIDSYLESMRHDACDGLIMTMTASDPKWSFVRTAPNGCVMEVAEKRAISTEATVGIYNFARGADFVASAEDMIARDERVNGEFYVAPAYNGLIAAGKRIRIHNIGAEGRGMYGLGIPADLRLFEQLPVCDQAVENARQSQCSRAA